MNNGFENNKLKVLIEQDEVNKLLKQYKKIKKYQKSSLYAIKTMDGTEEIVSSLIKEAKENPID